MKSCQHIGDVDSTIIPKGIVAAYLPVTFQFAPVSLLRRDMALLVHIPNILTIKAEQGRIELPPVLPGLV